MKTNNQSVSKQVSRGRRKRTGEARTSRMPLKMDRLPEELRQRVQRERAGGATWVEIEAMSPKFEEWREVEPRVLEMFPGRRLTDTLLHRWYDLRVEQVRRETRTMAEQARELASVFANSRFEDLSQALQGALRDHVFALMRNGDGHSRDKAIAELHKLAHLVMLEGRAQTEKRRVDILEDEHLMRKKKFNKEARDAAQKLKKRKFITPEELERIRVNVFGLTPRPHRPSSPPGPGQPRTSSGWPNWGGTRSPEEPAPQAQEPEEPATQEEI